MAIQDFKEIEERKGYLVEKEDRKIFQKEISKANFGLGCADMIEFILYDVSDNQLPQGDDGKLVRYIHLDDANISKYFTISDNIVTKKKGDVPEFIVDIEALIREAGYNNGIFKTQVTLLNRRLGNELGDTDKLWIHEISPSRTEIRVLPIRAKEKNEDLEKRYGVFTNGDTFRDDVIYYIEKFIESIDLPKIISTFLMSKGTEEDGKKYINKIKTEFKIESFDIFMYQVERKFIESMQYYARKRVWNINDVNYGKPSEEQDCVELSIKKLQQDAITALINSIDFNLPKRNIQENSVLTKEEQITLDKVKQILKSRTSDNIYDSTVIESEVLGCTDPKASNYNELSTTNDGSCEYNERIEVLGCTNPKAKNYNPKATKDDGSCLYEKNTITKKYYVWSNIGAYQYRDEQDNLITVLDKREFDAFSLTFKKGTFQPINKSDIREVPKMRPTADTRTYLIKNDRHRPRYFNHQTGGYNSNPYFNEQTSQSLFVTYVDGSGATKQSSTIDPGATTTICARKGSVSAPDGVSVIEQGTCGLADFQTVGNTGQGSPGAVGGGSSGGGFGGGPITGPGFGENNFNDIPTPGSPGVVLGPQTTYNIK